MAQKFFLQIIVRKILLIVVGIVFAGSISSVSFLQAQDVILSEDFEGVTVGQLPSGWTKYGTASFGVVGAAAENLFRKSIRISTDTQKTTTNTAYVYTVIPATQGYTYVYTCDVLDSTAAIASISIYWYPSSDGSGSSISSIEVEANNASSWQTLLLKETAPAGAGSAKVRINMKYNTPGIYNVYFDSVVVTSTEGLIPENTRGSLNTVITEVAPSESQDWIEFLVMEDGNTCGMKVYENKVLVKELQWLPEGSTYYVGADVKKGDYIILKFNSSLPDETSVRNGVITFYTSDSGLTGTDNVISLRKSATEYVDACAFSDYSGSISGVYRNELAYAINAGVWLPVFSTATATASEIENNMVGEWPAKAGYAITRKVKNVAGSRLPVLNTDVANSKDAWEIKSSQSPGKGYSFTTIESITLKVFDDALNPNPFDSSKSNLAASPPINCAKISFYVDDSYVKTLRVFDVRGREIVRLIDKDIKYDGTSLGGVGGDIIYWDGKDASGNRVPTGVYILSLEGRHSITSDILRATALVGVFRGKQ